MTTGDPNPLTYLNVSHNDRGFDVFRCENGFQSWNVAQEISEPTARVIAALLAGELLAQGIARAEADYQKYANEALALVGTTDKDGTEYTDKMIGRWVRSYRESRDEKIATLKARSFTLPADVPVRK